MPTDVQQYFKALPADRKVLVDKLQALIFDLYPDARVDMSYRMPTYKAGAGWVALANHKRYVSLYTCGAQHLDEFKRKHPAVRTGKGCINFKLTDTVPDEDIRQVIRHAIEHPK